MAETFTMNETPAEPEVLNSDEQDSLRIAESLEGGEQPLLAGKFKTRKRLSKPMLNFKGNWENHVMKYKAPKTKASQQHQPRKKKLHPTMRQMSKLFPRLKHKT